MAEQPSLSSNRRDFLTGRALQTHVERAGSALADEITGQEHAERIPSGGDTVRLGTRAMACDFSVILNPEAGSEVMAASDALDLVHALEDQMSVYRDHSEISQLNRLATMHPVEVESRLFDLLLLSQQLSIETAGAFDPTTGPLIALWRRCRDDGRIPTDSEIADVLDLTGIDRLQFDTEDKTVCFDRPGVELNLGGIGKGYALDRAAEYLAEQDVENFLIHGGHSSVLARGCHNNSRGWPVGIRNPLFPKTRLATILLRDGSLSSSGTAVQHFRHAGKRYGHILDPRTGRPAEEMLSVTVIAPTAARADALSTAFFVCGVEKTRAYCNNHAEVAALLIPPPRRGRTLEPINCGIPDEVLFFTETSETEENPGA